jgi:Tfp pilus assembly protein PilV
MDAQAGSAHFERGHFGREWGRGGRESAGRGRFGRESAGRGRFGRESAGRWRFGRESAGRWRRGGFALATTSAGFALIEVLISAVMLALIVIATFTGFDEANQSTADERARSEADIVAQQDEDRLRSFQISQLSGLTETHSVTYGGTEYTVHSSGEFISDTTGGTSCSTEAAEASYVRTISKVTWPGAGTRYPVVETGLITPPAGGQILVQVSNAKGAPVSGVTATATGPNNASALTGTQGCVIFAGLNEGEYVIKVHKAGYVTKEGVAEPEKKATVIAGTTEKKPFELDQAGGIAVSFEPSIGAEAKGDTFVAQNSALPTPAFRTFGTLGVYETIVNSGLELYPFGEPSPPAAEASGQYSVYAGTCPADSPAPFGVSPKAVNVLAGETVSVKVPLPAINIKLMSGKSSSPGSAVINFKGSFKDEGSECHGAEHPFTMTTDSTGELHLGMPFGKAFSLCVYSTEKFGTKYRKAENITIANELSTGTTLQTIYLQSSGTHNESESMPTCP